MPQIAQLSATYASQVFWLLLFFGAIFFVIGRGMVPRVMATVEDRNKRISDDLAAAEAARRDADRQEETWRVAANRQRAEAQALIAAAKADAAKATETRLAAAGATIDAETAAADARIAEARKSSLAELEAVAGEAARDIVQRLTGINVGDGDARAAVKGMLHG